MRARSRAARTGLLARALVGTLVVAGSLAVVGGSPASAVQTAQPTLVSPVPAAGTPDVVDGRVLAIAQIGGTMVLGGTFTSVTPSGDTSTSYSLPYSFAFNATSGVIDHTGFLPTINGTVDTVIPGPAAHEVYVGGSFSKIDGKKTPLALLDVRTGKIVSGWKPPAINGAVAKLVLAGGRLFVAGNFTTVNGVTHRGLATLNPTTGALTSYVDLSFTGHHNYGTKCDPSTQTCATGNVGVKSLDVNPAGTVMVAVGNFTQVSGQPRDQVAMIDLGRSSATVDTHWATLAYTAACLSSSFDSYIRDVQFAPDGSYFAIAATGGTGTNSDGTRSSCDAVARFNTTDTGGDVRPVWITYSGEDSLWTVAVTGTAIYVGGHQRWLNNNYGQDFAGQGAVPRPGIAALSPVSGLPYSWNPGRNPRGAGCFALLATSAGLWIGSDTDYIGDQQYYRPKVAFFPLAGGEAIPAETTPALPGRVYLVGDTSATSADSDRLVYREFDGSVAGAEEPLNTGVTWGSVRGAFYVDGELIYGGTDGNLYERSFDGTTAGTEVELDPYDDPYWDNVQTGSGQTYQGQPSTFSLDLPTVSSMFFHSGRLFYTMSGSPQMFWRWFEPESGVVGAQRHTVTGDVDWSAVAGAFLSAHTLYFADQTTGELMAIPWSGRHPSGSATVADTSTDWASRGLVLLSQSDAPTPSPVASFTDNCGRVASCTFQARSWSDPDGGSVRYEWRFGDGATAAGSQPQATHIYRENGTFTVRLTVTDTAGATSTVTHRVTIDAPVKRITFVGRATANGKSSHLHVNAPHGAKPGDTLVLTATSVSGTAPKAPAAWTLVGVTHHRSLSTALFERKATAHAVSHRLTVHVPHSKAATVVLTAYRHTAPDPLGPHRSVVAGAKSSLQAPRLHNLPTGSLVVGYWTASAKQSLSVRTPKGDHHRAGVRRRGRPGEAAALADRDAGSHAGLSLGKARFSRRSHSAAAWAVSLIPTLVVPTA